MLDRQTVWIGCLLAGLTLSPVVGRADDPPSTKTAKTATEPQPPLDGELLEYLGTVDSEGQDWMDYLSHTDIAHVARTQKAPAPSEDKEQ